MDSTIILFLNLNLSLPPSLLFPSFYIPVLVRVIVHVDSEDPLCCDNEDSDDEREGDNQCTVSVFFVVDMFCG